jgi:MFS family permease
MDQASNSVALAKKRVPYGWVVVAVCTLAIAITYGLMYSYSVFFKPLADYFHWDRATVSLIYSASLIIRGAVSVGIGWMADKYGPIKLTIFCGLMIALGLILSSQVHTLWQFFVTYAVFEAIGLSGAFGIGTAMVSRWFTKKRGLALAIISTGSGMGTLFIVPGNERIINAIGWSNAFIWCGAVAGVLMVSTAFLLRPPPQQDSITAKTYEGSDRPSPVHQKEANLGQALKDTRMLLFMGALFFSFSVFS